MLLSSICLIPFICIYDIRVLYALGITENGSEKGFVIVILEYLCFSAI